MARYEMGLSLHRLRRGWALVVTVGLLTFGTAGCGSSHTVGGGDEGRRRVDGGGGPGPDGAILYDSGPACSSDSCGVGYCACPACGGVCVPEGQPCPDRCPPLPADAGPGCGAGLCGGDLCACEGCFGEVFCVEPGQPCPVMPCPPPPVCDIDVCGPGACGCMGCEGEFFCIPESEPCPPVDCGFPWESCDEALFRGQTGDPCIGNWGCGAPIDACCFREARCEGGVLQAYETCDDGPCGEPCAPQEAFGQGPCGAIVGIFWNGRECVVESGCTCEGPDCGFGYMTLEECHFAHRDCLPTRSCGGFVSDVCGRNEYCDFYELGCDYADGVGECRPRPMSCTGQWDPVCACDGVTYVNECVAHLNGEDVAWPGPCEDVPPPPPPTRDCRELGCPAGTYCGGCLSSDGTVVYVCLENGTAC